MRLLNEQDFKELLEAGEHLADERMKRTPADAGMTLEQLDKTVDELVAAEDEWWAQRGLEASALRGYCVWEAEDGVQMTLRAGGVPKELGEADNVAVAIPVGHLKALLAAQAEIAFSVGWHMREKKYRRELH